MSTDPCFSTIEFFTFLLLVKQHEQTWGDQGRLQQNDQVMNGGTELSVDRWETAVVGLSAI